MKNTPCDLTRVIDGCKSCFMCRFICTSARTLNTEKDTPRGRSLLLYMVRKGSLPLSASVADAVFSCCLCAHCRASCISRYDFPAAAIAARGELARAGLLPGSIAAMRDSLVAYDNPYGHQTMDAALAETLAALPKTAGVLLLLGPDARYRRPIAALAAISVLKKLGIAFTCLTREPTSAYLLLEIGAEEESARKEKELAAAVAASGAKEVICLDPRTYYRMSSGTDSGPAAVRHFIEIAAENAGKFKAVSGGTFSYHDADFLTRWADMREQCDALLRALGAAYRAPYWKGLEAKSLGSVAIALYRPEFTRELARARIEDFAELGAARVLCATCDDIAALENVAAEKNITCGHIAEAVDAAL